MKCELKYIIAIPLSNQELLKEKNIIAKKLRFIKNDCHSFTTSHTVQEKGSLYSHNGNKRIKDSLNNTLLYKTYSLSHEIKSSKIDIFLTDIISDLIDIMKANYKNEIDETELNEFQYHIKQSFLKQKLQQLFFYNYILKNKKNCLDTTVPVNDYIAFITVLYFIPRKNNQGDRALSIETTVFMNQTFI